MLEKPMLREAYEREGYVVFRGIVPSECIDDLLAKFLSLTNKLSGSTYCGAHDPALSSRLFDDHVLQSTVYDAVRKPEWLVKFSKTPSLVAAVRSLAGGQIGLFSKIPFRIDVPREIKELAVWHQDHFYVKGNTSIVTAWIPMQDTNYLNGCLSVMPGSHKLGPVEHDVTVLAKRHFPSAHLDREIRLVEMKKGDVLLAHSCLLHSGNINLSDAPRYSVQARYTLLGEQTDPSMGEVIPL
jgi:ectoine hydroxylase-related dioxygenase (phytanoyl-CoA dioxygenase family)